MADISSSILHSSPATPLETVPSTSSSPSSSTLPSTHTTPCPTPCDQSPTVPSNKNTFDTTSSTSEMTQSKEKKGESKEAITNGSSNSSDGSTSSHPKVSSCTTATNGNHDQSLEGSTPMDTSPLNPMNGDGETAPKGDGGTSNGTSTTNGETRECLTNGEDGKTHTEPLVIGDHFLVQRSDNTWRKSAQRNST